VRELIFESEGEITGMFSVEGEKIPFMDSVNPAASGMQFHIF
jgi:dynein heavy chain